MTLVIRSNKAVTDMSIPILRRDPLLSGDNNGVLFLADFSSRYCYDGNAPVNGKAVVNINDSGNAASINLKAGQTLGFSGNGIDFTPVTGSPTNIVIPAAVQAALFSAQQFMVCLYMMLPSSADWNPVSNILPFLHFAPGADYTSAPDMVLMAFDIAATGRKIQISRQTAVGAATAFVLQPVAGDYGRFVQIAFWRNAAGQGARLKTVNGTVLATAVTGANNSANFSAHIGELGVPNCPAWVGATLSAGAQTAYNFKAYRVFIENLATSGRDPVTVLDADYARIVAKGVFT